MAHMPGRWPKLLLVEMAYASSLSLLLPGIVSLLAGGLNVSYDVGQVLEYL
jgi:hypothetical protein